MKKRRTMVCSVCEQRRAVKRIGITSEHILCQWCEMRGYGVEGDREAPGVVWRDLKKGEA